MRKGDGMAEENEEDPDLSCSSGGKRRKGSIKRTTEKNEAYEDRTRTGDNLGGKGFGGRGRKTTA